MARLARVVAIGFPHHVTHRGNRRADIFLSDDDRRLYLRHLGEYARSAALEVWAYCLMTNHVHLIVVPRREDSLAKGVGLAHRRYATALNRREGWSGHLWANRFFSTPLDDAHQWAAIRYVECNPVRAGMSARAEDHPWSSAPAHALGRADALLAAGRPWPGPVEDWSALLAELTELGDPGRDTARAGRAAAEIDRIRRSTKTGRPCGGARFVRMLELALGRRLRPAKRGRKPKVAEEAGQMDLLTGAGNGE